MGKVMFSGDNGYEVGDGDDRHVVRLDTLMCTCRSWVVSGISCSHAICAINHAKKDPKLFISHRYSNTTYMASYEVAMQHIPCVIFMNIDGFEKCEPPPNVRQVGRPKVKRIRGATKSMKGQPCGSLGRHGVTITFTICRVEGHNCKSCPKNLKNKEVEDTTSVDNGKRAMDKGKRKTVMDKGKRKTIMEKGEGNSVD